MMPSRASVPMLSALRKSGVQPASYIDPSLVSIPLYISYIAYGLYLISTIAATVV